MAGKQYVVIRPFRQTDPKTGKDTFYTVDDPYFGPVEAPYEYLLDPDGPDGKGSLVAEKSSASATDSSSKASSDSSGKEK